MSHGVVLRLTPRQAFKEIARGEQTATNMENQLTALERKLDDLLAQAEAQQQSNSASESKNPQSTGESKDEAST
jgi:hypothetical protein